MSFWLLRFYLLVRFVYISEKISQEEAKIEVAKNLVKEGVSVDIISKVTRLSIYEYDDIEKEICTDSILYKVGKNPSCGLINTVKCRNRGLF